GGTGIRAGIIKVATGVPAITPYERAILAAAAKASVATGAPITTHTDQGRLGDEQERILTEAGVPAHRIVIGHSCGTDDHAYHLAIARGGSYLGFRPLRHRGAPARREARRLAAAPAARGPRCAGRRLARHRLVLAWRADCAPGGLRSDGEDLGARPLPAPDRAAPQGRRRERRRRGAAAAREPAALLCRRGASGRRLAPGRGAPGEVLGPARIARVDGLRRDPLLGEQGLEPGGARVGELGPGVGGVGADGRAAGEPLARERGRAARLDEAQRDPEPRRGLPSAAPLCAGGEGRVEDGDAAGGDDRLRARDEARVDALRPLGRVDPGARRRAGAPGGGAAGAGPAHPRPAVH